MNLQRVVYSSKFLNRTPLGRSVNRLGKMASDAHFDIGLGRYPTEGMTFEVPKDQTAIIEFHPGALGEEKIAQLYGALTDAGLAKTEQILTTEAWIRP